MQQQAKIDGAKLRQLRKSKGMVQQTFADMVGISRSYLAELELGVKQPKKPVVYAMARCLNVDTGAFSNVRGYGDEPEDREDEQ